MGESAHTRSPETQLFHDVFNASPIGIAVETMEGQPLFVNPAFCSFLGFSEEELHTKHCVDFSPPEEAQKDWALFQQLKAGSIDHYQLEKRYFRKDGSLVWGRLSVSLLNSRPSPLVVAMVEDITENKRAHDELELVATVVGAAVTRCSRDLRYLWANKRYADWLQRPVDEIIGRPILEVLGTDAFNSLKVYFERVLAGESVSYEEEVSLQRVGKRWISATYTPTFAGGVSNGWIGFVIDITDRKRVEQAVKESEQRFRLVADTAPVLIWMSGTDKCCTYFNKPWLDFTGRSLEEEIGNGWAEGVHQDDLRRCLDTYTQSFDRREKFRMEYRLRAHGGEYRWVLDVGIPRFTKVGSFAGYIGTCVDINEHKRTEEALRHREIELTEAQRLAKVGSWQWDIKIDKVIWSGELYRLVHRDPNLPAPPFEEHSSLFTAESWERLQGVVKEALQTGAPYELDLEMLNPDSTTKWITARGEPLHGAADQIIGLRGTVQDITERKEAEETLSESEDKLRLLLDSTAEAIYGIDLEHRCMFCNAACLRALGYERLDEVLGRNMHELIHHTRADGSRFPAEECRVHRVLRTGEGDHAEDELLWRANGTSFPAEYWSYPQRKGQDLVGAVVAFIDITERKLAQAALADVNRKLIEAHEQERTRIGRELHDDIVQRLALLSIELEGVQRDVPDAASGLRTRIEAVRDQAIRMANDVQSLSHELHSSKLNYLGIAGAAKSFCKEFSEHQKLEIDFQSHDLPTALPDELSLSLFRVLQEALRNAAKHSGVKRFEVCLWGSTGEIQLTVTDRGAGFDTETALKSTGLGLTSMQERLRLVGGELSINSQPKGGTTIHARVPFDSSSDSARAAG